MLWSFEQTQRIPVEGPIISNPRFLTKYRLVLHLTFQLDQSKTISNTLDYTIVNIIHVSNNKLFLLKR